MSIFSSDKTSTTKKIITGRYKRKFRSTWFFLLCSLLYMTLPQLVFFLISMNYQYNYGIKDGLYFLIVGLFLWVDTFVISCIEKGIYEGLSFCGFISGIIITGTTLHKFVKLYQYVQTIR